MEIPDGSLLDRGSNQPLLATAVQRKLGARVGARATFGAGTCLSSVVFDPGAGGCLLAHAFGFAALDEKSANKSRHRALAFLRTIQVRTGSKENFRRLHHGL